MKQNNKIFIRLLVLFSMLTVLLSPVQTALASTCTSQATGNWNTLSTWAGCDGGIPDSGDDVIIDGYTVTLDSAGSANTLTIESDGTLTFDANLTVSGTSGDVLALKNDIDLDGNTLSLNGSGSSISYNIKVYGDRTVSSGASGSIFLITKTSDSKTVTVVADASGDSLTFGSDVKVEISGDSWLNTDFNLGASLTTINGTLQIDAGGEIVTNGPVAYGDDSTLNYNTGDGGVYSTGPEWPTGTGNDTPMNVQLSTSNTKIQLPTNSMLLARGDVTLASGVEIKLSSACSGTCGLTIYKNWYNNGGTLTPNSNYVIFKGSSTQIIGGSADSYFYRLRIDNTNGALLGHPVFVTSRLYLDNGRLTLGAYNLTMNENAFTTVSSPGTSKMIVADEAGLLCKIWETYGTVTNFWFYIGDDTDDLNYTPVTISLDEEDYLGYTLCMKVVDAKHPNLPASFTHDYLTRYWKITRSGNPASQGYTATFQYYAEDVVVNGGLGEDNIDGARYQLNNSTWWRYDPVDDTNHRFTLTSAIVDSNDELNEADYTGIPHGPTAVTMVDMKAIPEKGRVGLEWTTAQEINLLGFYVYRSNTPDGSGRVQISDFIPGQAGSAVGADYEFLDTTAEVGVTYYYWLEALGSGGSEFFGPLEAILLNQIYLPILRR